MKALVNKFLVFSCVGVAIASCKKEEDNTIIEEDTEIVGCMDVDAFNYNSLATKPSNNCTYIKTTKYEITEHAEFNGDGNDWDSFVNKKADLILKIKEKGATEWLFEGDVKNNHDFNDPAEWVAPNAEKLKNKLYEWELLDDESFGSDELMASGSFNPTSLTNSDNEIVTTFTDSNGLKTTLKIYYFIQ